MCKRVYLKAKEAEKEMQEARNENGFVGKNEELLVSNMIKMARNNSRVGDKLLMVVDPMQIHIPDWQRRIKLERAYSIGNNYNSYKWDEPKVLLFGKQELMEEMLFHEVWCKCEWIYRIIDKEREFYESLKGYVGARKVTEMDTEVQQFSKLDMWM